MMQGDRIQKAGREQQTGDALGGIPLAESGQEEERVSQLDDGDSNDQKQFAEISQSRDLDQCWVGGLGLDKRPPGELVEID
jgi:hypothetical protein